MPKIVVITSDIVAAAMAGPAIRSWRMAEALAREHDVLLASTERAERTHPSFRVAHLNGGGLAAASARADIVIVQGDPLSRCPKLAASDAVVVVDLYDPFHLEALEQTRGLPRDLRRRALWASGRAVDEQLRRGDFFLCASERQRDFWLGHLAAAGRVNERTYDANPDLRKLITVVPFGIDNEPPRAGEPAIRGVVPGIGPDDHLLFWGGGIYAWFDPLVLVHAVDRLRERVPTLRLFFAGMRHPNPAVGRTPAAEATQAAADRLGLTGEHVFFHDWIDYADRGRFLLEADVGVTTHADHIETAFSFRTRVLDYLWASLPVVTTSGDELARAVEAVGAGIAVPPGDVDALAAAIARLVDGPTRAAACRIASGELGRSFRWSLVLEPVLEFCRAPKRAPDLADSRLAPGFRSDRRRTPPTALRARGRRVLEDLRRGDLDAFAKRVRVRLSRHDMG